MSDDIKYYAKKTINVEENYRNYQKSYAVPQNMAFKSFDRLRNSNFFESPLDLIITNLENNILLKNNE